MKESRSVRVVLGPRGEVLSANDLPPAGELRWSMRKKATVVCAVKGGLISLADAAQQYDLSHDEYRAWHVAYEKSGLKGLRIERTFTERSKTRSGLLEVRVPPREGFTGLELTVYHTIRESSFVVTFEKILETLYGPRENWAHKKIIDVTICRLRKKIPAHEGSIQLVWGRGYKFIPPSTT